MEKVKENLHKSLTTEIDPSIVKITNQTNLEKMSLLMVNDDCLMYIMQFLKLSDLVNLTKTCSRLRDVGASIFARNYREIYIQLEGTPIRKHRNRSSRTYSLREDSDDSDDSDDSFGHYWSSDIMDNPRSERQSFKEFFSILSVIGEHVLKIKEHSGHHLILESIRDNCKNLKSIELRNCKGPLQLKNLRHLFELKLNGCTLDSEEFKNCLPNYPSLETLEYESMHQENFTDFMALSKILPKLKNLHLGYLSSSFHQIPQLHDLICLERLTTFSFRSFENCDELLTKLAKMLNLTELRVVMRIATDTFSIINSFTNLEVLYMKPYGNWNESLVPETLIFPKRLRHINFPGIEISCNTFLSIVKQLKFLKEFDFGEGLIFWDVDECKRFYQKYWL